MFEDIIDFIQKTYKTKNFIPLHEPKFLVTKKNILTSALIQLLFHRLENM